MDAATLRLLGRLLYCLLLTLAAELGVAALLRYRGWDLALIALVNCATNPVVNLLYTLAWYRSPAGSLLPYGCLAALELAVLFAEAWAFRMTLRSRRFRPLLLSLILNLSSFALGEIISLLLLLAKSTGK